MKIVDAVWEKRNLNVECAEVYIENDDDLDVVKEINSLDFSYQVVNIPAERVDLLLAMQQSGFMLIENKINLSKRIRTKDSQLPELYSRFKNSIHIREPLEREKQIVLEDVRTGKVFRTDRIALDPFFGRVQAGERYYYWICDMLENGGCMNISTYNDKIVGFGVVERKDYKVYSATIGGLLSGYANSGLGFSTIYGNTLSCINKGASKIVTTVSSNNLSVLKLHMLFEYDINGMEYVLIKHIKKK